MPKTRIHCLKCGSEWEDDEENPGPCPCCEEGGTYMRGEKLHEKEERLLEFIRELQFGELVIKVQDGLPMMIEKATEKVKL